MLIDTITYKLPTDNYILNEGIKKQIVIGHTFNHDMRHLIGWRHRYNGLYKKTAAFTIDAVGFVYQHFDPKYQSRYFNIPDLDNKTIVILLENDGWLLKDVQKNEFITWIGDIYNKPSDIVQKRWRGYDNWSPYTKEQFESAISLVKELCEDFNIPMISISHNTKVDNLDEFRGVVYKSNLDKDFTDLSPAWDCETFKNKIELK